MKRETNQPTNKQTNEHTGTQFLLPRTLGCFFVPVSPARFHTHSNRSQMSTIFEDMKSQQGAREAYQGHSEEPRSYLNNPSPSGDASTQAHSKPEPSRMGISTAMSSASSPTPLLSIATSLQVHLCSGPVRPSVPAAVLWGLATVEVAARRGKSSYTRPNIYAPEKS